MAFHRMLQDLLEGTSMGILESTSGGPTIVGALPQDISNQYSGIIPHVHVLRPALRVNERRHFSFGNFEENHFDNCIKEPIQCYSIG
jgi:hypothetical protein